MRSPLGLASPSMHATILFALIALAGTSGCLGHAGDADRLHANPAMNDAAKPGKEPLPASVDPAGYGEEYPERRR